MKRKLLTLGVALIFTLSATLSAFAAANPAKIITRNWTNFRGNQSHNAVVSDKRGKRSPLLGDQSRRGLRRRRHRLADSCGWLPVF